MTNEKYIVSVVDTTEGSFYFRLIFANTQRSNSSHTWTPDCTKIKCDTKEEFEEGLNQDKNDVREQNNQRNKISWSCFVHNVPS